MSTARLSRTITVRGPEQLQLVSAFIGSTGFAVPLDVQISEHQDKRSLPQNSLMWQRLDDIARQAWPGGRQFDAETWNEYAKREFLPDENWRGKKKWRVLPDGERVLNMSTSDLSVDEMTAYLYALEVWAAEMGVQLRA